MVSAIVQWFWLFAHATVLALNPYNVLQGHLAECHIQK